MTGPRDPASLLKILSFSCSGSSVNVIWASFPGLSYTFEYVGTLNFGSYLGLCTATGMSSGNSIGPITGPEGFFRIAGIEASSPVPWKIYP